MRATPPSGPTWRYLVGALVGTFIFAVPGFLWAGSTSARVDAQDRRIDRIEYYLERIETKLDKALLVK